MMKMPASILVRCSARVDNSRSLNRRNAGYFKFLERQRRLSAGDFTPIFNLAGTNFSSFTKIVDRLEPIQIARQKARGQNG